MKKFAFIIAIVAVVCSFSFDSALARSYAGYHDHDGKRCYRTATGLHKPVSYDNVFLDKLIKHDQNTIKQAQDIFQRADREELKQVAQDIINSHTQEKERLELLRKEWFNK